jgi:hypothetical protein
LQTVVSVEARWSVAQRVAEAVGVQPAGYEPIGYQSLGYRLGHDHGHGSPTESTREVTYRGHHIRIRTTYHIEVDGMPIQGHLGVTNDGQVHYHAIPNLSFASAVDMVNQLIDTFPEDFEAATDQHSHGQGS